MRHGRPDYDARIQDSARLIPDDEPVFLFRGQDLLAAPVILAYAAALKRAGGDQAIVESTIQQANKMIDWQRDYHSQLPSLPNKTKL